MYHFSILYDQYITFEPVMCGLQEVQQYFIVLCFIINKCMGGEWFSIFDVHVVWIFLVANQVLIVH